MQILIRYDLGHRAICGASKGRSARTPANARGPSSGLYIAPRCAKKRENKKRRKEKERRKKTSLALVRHADIFFIEGHLRRALSRRAAGAD